MTPRVARIALTTVALVVVVGATPGCREPGLGHPAGRAGHRLREHAPARPRRGRGSRRGPRRQARPRRCAPKGGGAQGARRLSRRHQRPRGPGSMEPGGRRRKRPRCGRGLFGDRLYRRLPLGSYARLGADHERGPDPPGLAGQRRGGPGAAVPGRRGPGPRGGPDNRRAHLRSGDPKRRGAGRGGRRVGQATWRSAGGHGLGRHRVRPDDGEGVSREPVGRQR